MMTACHAATGNQRGSCSSSSESGCVPRNPGECAYFQTQEAPTGPAAAPAPAPEKVMRDGFTIPAEDYALIAQLQATGLEAGLAVSKSAVLRAGLHALKAMSPDARRQVFAAQEMAKPCLPPKRQNRYY